MSNKNFSYKNMGTLDRIIRVAVAAVIAVLYFTEIISGIWAIALGLLALVFTLTAMVGSCPLYLPFGLSSLRKKISQ